MRKFAALFALIFAVAGFAPVAHSAPERYAFDKAHTNILFFVSHLGFSRMQGELKAFGGGFEFDPDNVGASSASVTIETASVDMDHDKLNAHLRAADFFDVANHPTMIFVSTRVEKTGDNTGRITGNLTLLGVTKPVTLDVTFNKAGNHPIYKKWYAGFLARETVKRSDFDMTYGVPGLGDEIEVVLEVEGARQ